MMPPLAEQYPSLAEDTVVKPTERMPTAYVHEAYILGTLASETATTPADTAPDLSRYRFFFGCQEIPSPPTSPQL